MKPEELALLLTVARILRARIKFKTGRWDTDDVDALCEALAPFDGNGEGLRWDGCAEASANG